MREIEKQTCTNALILKTVLFCLFFSATAISIAIFLPAKAVADTSTDDQIVEVFSDDFFINEDADFPSDFPSEFRSFSRIDTQTVGLDKGLELYRDAHTKAAVEWFYLHITGNRDVTHAILQAANKNDIPLSLAFALAYVESRYKANAVNKNSNASIDRGLFQLNSNSFPQLNENDFFNPEISAYYGMQHLRFCMEVGGKEVTALAMYNAGTVRVRKNNTPSSTLNYVDAIMRYRAGLDSAFEDEIVALYKPVDPVTSIAMAK